MRKESRAKNRYINQPGFSLFPNMPPFGGGIREEKSAEAVSLMQSQDVWDVPRPKHPEGKTGASARFFALYT